MNVYRNKRIYKLYKFIAQWIKWQMETMEIGLGWFYAVSMCNVYIVNTVYLKC